MPVTYKVYPYRWVVLAVFMLINLTIQIEWICFAPITGPAASYYGVTSLQIGFFAMSFMVVYIPLSIPISWMIDTLGYRKAVGIGAALMGGFSLLRGLLAADYTWVLISTLGVAVAQPFLMNAISTVAGRWFPIQERATASGLPMVANFVGTAIGQVVTPLLITGSDGSIQVGLIPSMLVIYGVVNAAGAVLFLLLNRDAPPTPPCPPGLEGRALMFDGLKTMLKLRDVWLLLALFLIGMGIFNGVSTWIEGIISPRGFAAAQVGEFGAFLLLGGIVGAVVIPALSDKFRRRKLFLLVSIVCTLPWLVGITFATSYELMAASMFLLGFFLVSLAPLGYQYAAEITYPAPEGTSNGLLNLAGQASVVFVYAMEAIRGADGSFTLSLLILVGLMVLGSFLASALAESKLIQAQA